MTINVNCPPRGLFIGHETENVARALTVDFSAWAAEYSTGTLQILFQPPGAERPYAVVLTRDGTTATWKPSETDLAEAGTGAVQLVYTVGEVRVKTSIIPVMVEPSLGVETDPPEGWTSWIDQLTDLAAETEQHASSAAESARNAAASAAGALQSATDAGSAKNAAVAAAEAAAASVSHYPQIVGGVWYVWSPTAGEYISTGIDAQGEDGVSPAVEITAIQGGHRVVITDADGPHTFDVLDGVTPDMSAYRTAADQDEIDDAQDEQIDDLKSALDTKAGILRDTVSGSVASFVPDSTVPNLLGLSVALEPIQDLHGYDSPWPAGGGKNLLHVDSRVSQTTAGVTYSSDDEYIYLNGTKSGQGYVSLRTMTLDLETGTYYARAFVISGTASNSVAIYANNGTSDFGGNINGALKTYTITDPTTVRFRFLIAADGTVLTNYKIGIVVSKSSDIDTFYPYSNLCPISGRGSVEVNANGTTYTIQLGDTVYGGTLDVTAGTLTVDRAMVDMGTLNWTFVASDTVFYSAIADKANGAANLRCSCYKTGGNTGYSTPDYTVGYSTNSSLVKRVFVGDPNYTTAADFKATVTGQTLLYDLANPIVIDLDPVAIATIAGQTNNVWADAGDVTVEFAADLKTYIDNKIAAAVAALS